jgi:hypothetical protein
MAPDRAERSTKQVFEAAGCRHLRTVRVSVSVGQGAFSSSSTYNATKPFQHQDTEDVCSFDIGRQCYEAIDKVRLKLVEKLQNAVVFPEEVGHVVGNDMVKPLLDAGT